MVLDDMVRRAAPRIGDGGTISIQTGDRLNLFQEMLGSPAGFVVSLVIVARRPSGIPHPEPMSSRDSVPMMIFLTKTADDQPHWRVSRWIKTNVTLKFKKKPSWVIVCFGRSRGDADLHDLITATPLEVAADQREAIAQVPVTFGTVMKTLTEGSSEDKLSLLLRLHKRFYHRPSDQLRALLRRAGVPIRTLV